MADMNFPADPPPTPSAGSPGRRSLFWPAVLISAGVVALLFNTGWLTWEKVAWLYRLWPLLLIALGVAIIFRRGLPGRLFTFVIAVLLVLLLVALGSGLAALPGALVGSSGPFVTTHSSGPTGEVSAPKLDLSAGAAKVTVRAGSIGGDLYRATFESPSDERPAVNLDSASGTLHVDLPGRSGFHWGTQNDHRSIDLTLNDQLPWVVGLSSGASQTSLDLSGLKVASVTVESGASSVDMTLPKPAGTVPVHVSGGAMHLTIQRPTGTPIRVSASGGATSLDVDGQHFGGLFGANQDFSSPDYSSATDRYDISIESGASSVGIS
jgi:hypothetical protein